MYFLPVETRSHLGPKVFKYSVCWETKKDEKEKGLGQREEVQDGSNMVLFAENGVISFVTKVDEPIG